MNYCENCKRLCEEEVCSFCGNKKLRKAEADDFCFLFECDTAFGDMFAGILKDEGIACVLMPSGSGVRSYFGLNLENYKVYVPFEFYDTAVEIWQSFYDESENDLKNDLLYNIDKWYIQSSYTERKIKKALKLFEEDDVFEACKKLVLEAEKISDEGLIGYGGHKGGHYIFVYTDSVVLSFNSATYEILGINKR